MPQRLDDVTGDPIRLSATQRERQREQMIAQINAQTRQINALTKAVDAHSACLQELIQQQAVLRADDDAHLAWHRQPFWQRWFTGR